MSRRDPLADVDALRRAVAQAKLPASPPNVTERARKILLAFLDAAAQQGRSARQIAQHIAAGGAALTAARVALDQMPPDPAHACRTGCAFCCILAGDDGAVVSLSEARALHTTLLPLAGQPDGRAWHPRACPSLDPETRMCRAYDARPVICRSFVSTNAAACEAASQGSSVEGPGVLGPHVDYLTILALGRSALKGVAKVSTFSLAAVAAAAVEGRDLDEALNTARHRPKTLDDERKRIAGRA